MWKKSAVAYFKVLSMILTGEAEQKHEDSQTVVCLWADTGTQNLSNTTLTTTPRGPTFVSFTSELVKSQL
jgi:hypothetical protein